MQAGSSPREFALTGEAAHYSIIGLREMVVVARYYIDDPNNRSKRFVEYSCRDLQTAEVFPGCRQLSAMGGVDDGDDNTLHPSTAPLGGGFSAKFNAQQAFARDSDGDQVLVGFVEGSRARPVILGVFRQIGSNTYGATAAQGERRLTQHKGTTVEIQKDGKYIVTGITEAIFDGTTVKLGAQAQQPVIRGNDMNTDVLTPISNAANTLLVKMGLIPAMLVPATLPNVVAAAAAIALAVGTFSASLSAAIAAFPSTLSTKVETE
jgi:hypothetical protein